MRKQIIIATVMVLGLVTGCGGAPTVAESQSAANAETDAQTIEGNNTQNRETESSPDTGKTPVTESAAKQPEEQSVSTAKDDSVENTASGSEEAKEAIEARITDKNIVISGKVLFETGNAKLKPVSFPVLDQVVEALKKHPEIVKLHVVGHTDSDGNANANKSLSKRRATSVVNYLVKNGIEADRLAAVGAGQDVPIASNDTPEGKEKNRRVEFDIIERVKLRAFKHTAGTASEGAVNKSSKEASDDEIEEMIVKDGLDKKF